MAFSISQAVLTHRESLSTFPIPGHPDWAMTFKNYRVTGNMISGAAQQHKKRLIPLRKTDAMSHAARHNGRTLDDIWKNGGNDVFQVSATFSDKRVSQIAATRGS
ncbi:hypothetical protein WR25_15916 [Diploscapter pachys]|uniref:Uncharacterized protein n=1 Tax=Diploscapter pachys TaxID=2018661 RepID=A0A2A2JMB4_9BILA|nr:hypothetical protein WR25_15916 [Diploscapter pachys]